MALLLRYERDLTEDDGDQWLAVDHLFVNSQILVAYNSPLIPETWDYLGRAFRLQDVSGRWAVAEYERFWPNRQTLISWDVTEGASYRIEFRLVRYLRPGRLSVWELDST